MTILISLAVATTSLAPSDSLPDGWRACGDRPPGPGGVCAVWDPVGRVAFRGTLIKGWENGFSLVRHLTPAGSELLIGTVGAGLLCPAERDK